MRRTWIFGCALVAAACSSTEIGGVDVQETAKNEPAGSRGLASAAAPGGACVKVSDRETTCDGKDDDCNGIIDDVDLGNDGICDCLRIGLLGRPGYYGSNDFQAWLEQQGTSVTRIQFSTDEPLTAKSLAPFDIVVFDWLQRDYDAEETKVFRDWLSAGHGALALSGFSETYPVERPNAFLEHVGLSFTSSATLGGKQSVTELAKHPIATDVGDVTFYGGSEVLVGDGARASGRTVTPIARIGQRSVSVAVEEKNARVLAWGDEWIEFDSEWQTKPDIPRLWANVFSFLAPRCTVPPPVK